MTGVVYFVGSPGRIKVGFTRDLESRFRTLRGTAAGPLSILGSIRADRRVEKAFHILLRPARIRGEWFHDCEAVRTLMKAAFSGQIDVLLTEAASVKPPIDSNVEWAGRALRHLAGPDCRELPFRVAIKHAADQVGLNYWRAFNLWYGKAARLEISERNAIAAAVDSAS